MVGWTGIADEDGTPIPFEDEAARRAVLDRPYIYYPVRDAVLDELMRRRAPEKN